MAEKTLDELFDEEFDKYPVIYNHPHKNRLKKALIRVCNKNRKLEELIEKLGDRFIRLEQGATCWECHVYVEEEDAPLFQMRVVGATTVEVLNKAIELVEKMKGLTPKRKRKKP